MEKPGKPVLLRRYPIPEDKVRAEYLCHCGKVFISHYFVVERGACVSCGCYRRSIHTKHGLGGRGKNRSRAYRIWASMRQRCDNSKNPRFHRYGGRGITYCDRWQIFENFLEDMGHPPDKHTLDRIDNDGNYEKKNCKWSTNLEQSRNRLTNQNFMFRGKMVCVADLVPLAKVTIATLYRRLVTQGWDAERAVTEPPNFSRKKTVL